MISLAGESLKLNCRLKEKSYFLFRYDFKSIPSAKYTKKQKLVGFQFKTLIYLLLVYQRPKYEFDFEQTKFEIAIHKAFENVSTSFVKALSIMTLRLTIGQSVHCMRHIQSRKFHIKYKINLLRFAEAPQKKKI